MLINHKFHSRHFMRHILAHKVAHRKPYVPALTGGKYEYIPK